MKSSTLRRANLTREKMAVLEALAKYNSENASYTQKGQARKSIQPLKQKEIDALWQHFKVHSSKHDKSPAVYLITGVIIGAVAMLIMTTMVSFSVKSISDKMSEPPVPAKVDSTDLQFIPADSIELIKNETYKVQPGDTLESIIIRFYGSFDNSKVEKIKQANNLANPNALQIGQTLNIPIEK